MAKKRPVARLVKDETVGKVIWRTCRKGCGSNQAKITMIFALETGGRRIRYRCEGCGHASSVLL